MVRIKRPVKPTAGSGLELFLRLWDKQRMTPSLARHLLKMKFSKDDKTRMHQLAERNQAGMLSPGELAELNRYVDTGMVMSILQSRARQVLKKNGTAPGRG